MSRLTRWLDRRFYPEHRHRWDDLLFRDVILEELRPEDRVLDLGAGAGRVVEMDFRGHARRICGVDPDERVLDNPFLDEARVGYGESIPWDDESFDLVFADNVLEHLSDPVAVFREVRRVLAPGGRLLVKTPNFWHYVPLLASATPHGFHQRYNAWRGRDEGDTFPTVYRANTPRALREIAARSGFAVREVRLVEGRPEYLRLTAPTYLAGIAYERVVNRVGPLQRFRVLMIGILDAREPQGPGDPSGHPA